MENQNLHNKINQSAEPLNENVQEQEEELIYSPWKIGIGIAILIVIVISGIFAYGYLVFRANNDVEKVDQNSVYNSIVEIIDNTEEESNNDFKEGNIDNNDIAYIDFTILGEITMRTK